MRSFWGIGRRVTVVWLAALLAGAVPARAVPPSKPGKVPPPVVSKEDARILPWGGAVPEPPEQPYKGPYQATLNCTEAVKSFPFLKPWVAKLDDFIAPIEIGSTEGSLFYAIGVTTVSSKAVELWTKDSYKAPVDWKGKGGSIESVWLGPFPGAGPVVKPGPGFATVRPSGRSETWSQMTSRRDSTAGALEPAIQGYTANAIKDSAALGVSQAWDRMWAKLLSAQESALLGECTQAECMIKFNVEELKAVTGSSHQYRLSQMRQLVERRIEEYKKAGRIWAYEGTHKPMDWEDLPIGPEFPAKYNTHFWEPSNRGFFGYDILDAEPGHQKPVVGLYSRQCEPRGTGPGRYTACTDIVLYNNHYFDYWARLVYFFPWCGVQVAMAYETMDIDQIKESRIVRILFGGEIRKLMALLLETRLKHLHMLGF